MPDYNATGYAPEVAPDVARPSKGLFHVLAVPGNEAWVDIVRTAVPMGAVAFERRLPDMVREEHYVVVGRVHCGLAESVLCGLEMGNDGVQQAHAAALVAAKAHVPKASAVRGVMYDHDTGGWWVTLAGQWRFYKWAERGMFSATTAHFQTWEDLADAEFDPHERDIGDEVKLRVDLMLSAAGVSVKRCKVALGWTCREAVKPYYTKTERSRVQMSLNDMRRIADEGPGEDYDEPQYVPEHVPGEYHESTDNGVVFNLERLLGNLPRPTYQAPEPSQVDHMPQPMTEPHPLVREAEAQVFRGLFDKRG